MIDLLHLEKYQENNRIEAKKALGGLPKSIWETYITITGVVKKIKTYERQIQMTTGDLIPIDMIFGIEGEIFSRIDY